MRTSGAVVVFGLLVAIAPARADDTVPKAAAKYAAKLEHAIDKEQLKSFVALLPAKVDVGGKTYTRAELRKAIGGLGSIGNALWLADGVWTARKDGDLVELVRGSRDDTVSVLVLTSSKGAWHLTSISLRTTEPTVDGTGPRASVPGGLLASPADPAKPTIGHGTGYGVGGGGCGGLRAGHADSPSMKVGTPTVTGKLDAAIVRRYLRRNASKLLYCYEKELVVKPTLAGTATATFTITGAGAVTKSSVAGLDAAVDSCMPQVIDAIEFPRPKGSADVDVAVAFTLKPTGG